MPRGLGGILLQQDPRWLVLAACLCALTCGTTVKFMASARTTRPGSALAWLVAAACVFGGGVWSLGLLAVPAGSSGAGIGMAAVALAALAMGGALLALLAWRFARPRWVGAMVGGGLLGLTVAGTQFGGVAASRLYGVPPVDGRMVLASAAIGISFAILGLARSNRLGSLRRRFEVATWWALGIVAAHVVGLAAFSIAPDSAPGSALARAGVPLGAGGLAAAVGSVGLAILIANLAGSFMARSRRRRLASEPGPMRLLIDIEPPAAITAPREIAGETSGAVRFRHFTCHEALSNLPNRAILIERLSRALDTAHRAGTPLALLYLDLDRFKPVNDLLGHEAGDALLIEVANRLCAGIRPLDTATRVGGDQFVIAACVDRPDDAAALAERLIDVLAPPFDVGGQPVEIGVSIGIALSSANALDGQSLLRAAETALYRAKQENRGSFRFFEAAMDEDLRRRHKLENDLRHALERDQFVLHYQPLVSCATGEVEGFEALLRWNHPERGMVGPAEFIPLAEATGLIVKIGEWVLESACRAASGWSGKQWVAVNFSPVQFRQPDLAGRVAATLARTGLRANRLEIEITEGVFINEVAQTAEILARLRHLGIRVALDDFGTGYSSLSYLHSYRIDKLKLDKTFIDRLGQESDASTIVRTIIGLAHGLGLSIVAEGVETPGQLAIIREYMCDQAQGYLLGRPMRMEAPVEATAARAKLLLFGEAPPDPALDAATELAGRNVLVP